MTLEVKALEQLRRVLRRPKEITGGRHFEDLWTYMFESGSADYSGDEIVTRIEEALDVIADERPHHATAIRMILGWHPITSGNYTRDVRLDQAGFALRDQGYTSRQMRTIETNQLAPMLLRAMRTVGQSQGKRGWKNVTLDIGLHADTESTSAHVELRIPSFKEYCTIAVIRDVQLGQALMQDCPHITESWTIDPDIPIDRGINTLDDHVAVHMDGDVGKQRIPLLELDSSKQDEVLGPWAERARNVVRLARSPKPVEGQLTIATKITGAQRYYYWKADRKIDIRELRISVLSSNDRFRDSLRIIPFIAARTQTFEDTGLGISPVVFRATHVRMLPGNGITMLWDRPAVRGIGGPDE